MIATWTAPSAGFQRNGSWYDGGDARAHLQRKYDYLLKKDMVDSAEQFNRARRQPEQHERQTLSHPVPGAA